MIDIEDVYDERISPLMAQIIAVCKEAGMPLVASSTGLKIYAPHIFYRTGARKS